MNALILTAAMLQAASPQNRLLVAEGADTTAHAATDTIEVMVGRSLELLPRIVAAGKVLDRKDLWVHNVSPEFVSFDGPIGNDRFSADPIRVTGVQPGVAPVMVHWSTDAGGAIFIMFRVVRPKDSPAGSGLGRRHARHPRVRPLLESAGITPMPGSSPRSSACVRSWPRWCSGGHG